MTLVLAILWLLAGPIAMAFDGCVAMMSMCEGPCALALCALLLTTTVIILAMVAALPQLAAAPALSATIAVPELPPRSSLRFA